jgi:non-lysosomal glucosylceramidase
MAWEGMVTEALAICRGVHERYHPAKQNPWNEVECGDHYSRAMASHGVFLGLCGFENHGPKGRIGFAPRLNPENFRASFTTAEGWGGFSQKISGKQLTAEIKVKWGQVPARVISLEVPQGAKLRKAALTLNGKTINATATQEELKVVLKPSDAIILKEGGTLGIRLSWA